MKTVNVLLSGISYTATETDGQLIFEEVGGFYGTFSRFTFEWRGCGWYLVDFEDWAGHIYVPHICAALKWVNENYEYTYKEGNATIKLKNTFK